MKTLIAVLVGVGLGILLFTTVVAPRSTQAAEPPRSPGQDAKIDGPIYPIAHNLYVIPGGGGNTAVFVAASGVLLVDTKYSETLPAVLEQVRRVTDKPIVYAINTHIHSDHSGGNRSLPANTEIIAHANTVQRGIEWE